MAISLAEFNELHAVSKSNLEGRVLAVLGNSDKAHTAEEVTAQLLGITNRYLGIMSPEIAEVQPLVAQMLDMHVAAGKLRFVRLVDGWRGICAVYAKPERAPG